LPGFQLIASSLHEYTALLPLISLDELAVTLERDANSPPSIGKTTRQAIQSGIYWSQVGAVREILDRISNEFAIQPQLFLTGGGGHFLFAQFSHAQFEPNLSLQGLVLATNRKA
jgi:type III pantothenate kinase